MNKTTGLVLVLIGAIIFTLLIWNQRNKEDETFKRDNTPAVIGVVGDDSEAQDEENTEEEAEENTDDTDEGEEEEGTNEDQEENMNDTDQEAEQEDDLDEDTTEQEAAANDQVEGEEDTEAEDTAEVAHDGYMAYSQEILDQAIAAGEQVALFFHATRCPTCKALETNILANESTITKGNTILKVDYDLATELKDKYEVTAQHTLVYLDADQNMIKSERGTNTLEEVLADF